jgi:hypothetical protein
LLIHKENISKNKNCTISLNELKDRIKNWENKYGSYENKIDYEMLKKYNPKQIGPVVH